MKKYLWLICCAIFLIRGMESQKKVLKKKQRFLSLPNVPILSSLIKACQCPACTDSCTIQERSRHLRSIYSRAYRELPTPEGDNSGDKSAIDKE